MIIRTSTLLELHRTLTQRKYRQLHSSDRKGKPWPKGPSPELIQAIIELKLRNPCFVYPRIVQQINIALGSQIDKDVMRCVLINHYRQVPDGEGGGIAADLPQTHQGSLLSIDLFGCESILLESHRVLVVMDQFTRRIIGFVVHAGDVDCNTLYRINNTVIFSAGATKSLRSDYDPLFLHYRLQAHLRILGTAEVKTVPIHPRHILSPND